MISSYYFLALILAVAAGALKIQQNEADPSCRCNTKKVWNDVVFVMEISNSTSAADIKSRYTALTQLLANNFNVQPLFTSSTNYYLQVGLILYNSYTRVVGNLGSSLDTFTSFDTDTAYDQNDGYSDLGEALLTANNQFDFISHRPASRKVIMVIGSKYNPLGKSDSSPQEAARIFQRQQGGILITYDIVPSSGELESLFDQIASPNYNLNSLESNLTEALNTLCDANCFCPMSALVYKNSERLTPLDGCYQHVEITANEPLAQKGCINNYNGILVKIEDISKNSFISQVNSQFSGSENSWIGLTWDHGLNQWIWGDGTALGSYDNFNSTNSHTTGNDCVTLDQKSGLWKSTACRVAYQYICEYKACDSNNFCPNNSM